MKISIVTISYNQAQFLEKTILSVINQKGCNIEYIVVDAGSTDGSHEIIKKYHEKISKIIFEVDSGPAEGLTKGFSHATGDIYYYLNSDDILEPNALKQVIYFIEQNPKVDVFIGNSYVVNSDGAIQRKFISDNFIKQLALYNASCISQASTFFRSNIFKKTGGFNQSNKVNWDGELLLDMMQAGANFLNVNLILSRFRVYPGSITGSRSSRIMTNQNFEKIFIKLKGRKPNRSDRALFILARLIRKLLNPVDTFERLRHGPI